jgi:hypothetical protein
MPDTPRVAKKEWNPEAQLEDLMLESQFDAGDAAATTARLLREHALVAAESIAHLSAHAHNERVRLQAAQYIVERVLDSALDHDIVMQRAQIKLIGQAMQGVVRALGMRYQFDPDAPEVKMIAQETMLALAASTEKGGPT